MGKVCVTSIIDKEITLTYNSYWEKDQIYEWIVHRKEMQLALNHMKESSTSLKWKKLEKYWDTILVKSVKFDNYSVIGY